MDPISFRKSLEEVARKAGDAVMEIYKDSDRFNVEQKTDNSPLTEADKASNKIICDCLEQMYGGFPIVSEENKMIPHDIRKDYEYYWCVDPLDGTKEFIKRNGEFTINIALIRKSRPVMGVIFIPVTDEMFFAMKGEGAWYSFEGKERQLKCKSFSNSDAGLHILCSRSHLNDRTREYVDQFQEPEMVPRGSSLKFLEIAKGVGDLYPRLGPTMEWDTAAAQIILEEAGGQILEWESRTPLIYNKENLLNPEFIAVGVGTAF